MDKYYNKNINEIYDYFNSSIEGLNSKTVDENMKKFGSNVIKEKQKKSIIKIFFDQFKDTLVIILIISAIISIFLNEVESTIVIFVVIYNFLKFIGNKFTFDFINISQVCK